MWLAVWLVMLFTNVWILIVPAICGNQYESELIYAIFGIAFIVGFLYEATKEIFTEYRQRKAKIHENRTTKPIE